ncbi:MAG TPA: hypothetical protein VNS80_00230 [Pseudolysinimonas sp.]|nr:hypothetical protein [Pseudolysinimonas sp.]
MYGTLLFAAGLGVGYVVGTSRGRKDFDKLKMRASQVWLDPRVQKAANQASDVVEKNVPMGEKVGEAVDAATKSARATVGRPTQGAAVSPTSAAR